MPKAGHCDLQDTAHSTCVLERTSGKNCVITKPCTHTIRYDAISCFNVRSKADVSGTEPENKKREKRKAKNGENCQSVHSFTF